MPLAPAGRPQNPDAWTAFGHSYLMHGFGVAAITGRFDNQFKASMDIEGNNWVNQAVTGARLSIEGWSQGGYARVQRATRPLRTAAPYYCYGGATLLCWGINDLGFNGDTAQYRTAQDHASRYVISLRRAARYLDTSDAAFAYGGAWTNVGTSVDFTMSESGGLRQATVTTRSVTLTIPSDYTGTPIALAFVVNSGVAGGVVTFSGTAGITGTLTLSNIMPAATLNHSPVIQRITSLTAANAGQTIIVTVTSLDASGNVNFDGAWIEGENPPPILVCGMSRLTHSGYAGYSLLSGNSDATNDASVQTWNTQLQAVVAEFDEMVRYIDIDAALGVTGSFTDTLGTSSDGLHPNERGGAAIASKCVDTIRTLTSRSVYGTTAQINTPSNRLGSVVFPRFSGNWYTSQAFGGANGTAQTAVSGDVWAIPFFETRANARWIQWCIEHTASTVAGSVWFSVYDDRAYSGRPCTQYVQTCTSALTLATGTGVKVSTTTSGQNGYLSQPIDYGLYWLVLKIATAGTNTMKALKGPDPFMPNLSSTGLSIAGGYCGFKLSGQGTGALPTNFAPSTAWVLSDNVPFIGLKYQ